MLVMSVERYEDPDMELFRSNDDAAAVTRAFERQKGRLFADVKIKSLVGRQVNLREIKGTLDSFDTGINDVVIVFAAGHGTVEACDDAQRKETYYFMTYPASLSSRSEICSQALSIDYLAELLDGLEANKKLLLFDSCKSGRAASAASTGDNQSAIESDELGHGLFTYVLLEGLQAKPIVSIYSLADHVDHHLDLLASSHGRRQQATVATRGQNFSIYSVHPGDPSLIAAPQEPARRSDVLPQGLHERVAEHLRARSELILECLGRSAATVEAEVNDDGQVIFRAARVDPGSVEQRCMDEAIPPLRLEGARGWTRVPLSRPPPQ